MLCTRSWGLLAIGLVLGLTIGTLTQGVWRGGSSEVTAPFPGLEELKLKASASSSADNFAVATGPIDDEVEGLFTLDYLTGDLQCFVPNPRTGGMAGWFKANVANDMAVERGKKPNYLLVTGLFNFTSSTGNQRPASSLVYVVDSNSGQVVCYTFPWNKSATAAGATQAMPMIPAGTWKARAIAIRK